MNFENLLNYLADLIIFTILSYTTDCFTRFALDLIYSNDSFTTKIKNIKGFEKAVIFSGSKIT